MRDVLPYIREALTEGRPFAWARVVRTWGSAPRRPGACMVVRAPDAWAGSVSGGCVEHAVIDECVATIVSGRRQLLEYGIADDTARSVGLSCGGTLHVLVEPWPAPQPNGDVGRILVDRVASDTSAVLVSALDSGAASMLLDESGGHVAGPPLPDGIAEEATGAFGDRAPRVVDIDERRWFVHPFPPRERLVVVGGAEIADHLVGLARLVGFETIRIDSRSGDRSSWSQSDTEPDRVVTDSVVPALDALRVDLNTFVVLLSHDAEVDDAALHSLLASDAVYIGVLGGRRTQEKRRNRLVAAGFDDGAIARMDAPIGVPIGAVTPAEIAVSIVARLVEVRRRAR